MTPNQELAVLVAAAIVVWAGLLVMVIRGENRMQREDEGRTGRP